ncbi:MAG: 1-acyl-sn-glycerol-3-phosphate acyltransferase [Myxococcota bacterium]|nr:1-acyl-sn-glycerol-3-phosphate acyltransferase [Myxococcota bacterium]
MIYFLRWLWGVLFTEVMVTLAILSFLISPRGNVMYWMKRNIWAPGLFKVFGIQVETTGAEKIDWSKAHIVMANHCSNLDIVALTLALPVNIRFVAKKELMYLPLFGQMLWFAGFPFIDRRNRAAAIRTIARAAENIVRKKHTIIIFPEGTRSRDGVLQEFKKGPFHMVEQARAPVIPVRIRGMGELMPPGSLKIRSGKVRVHIGDPIDADLVAGDIEQRRAKLAELVREAILSL